MQVAIEPANSRTASQRHSQSKTTMSLTMSLVRKVGSEVPRRLTKKPASLRPPLSVNLRRSVLYGRWLHTNLMFVMNWCNSDPR
jgi:hypothetical protein